MTKNVYKAMIDRLKPCTVDMLHMHSHTNDQESDTVR